MMVLHIPTSCLICIYFQIQVQIQDPDSDHWGIRFVLDSGIALHSDFNSGFQSQIEIQESDSRISIASLRKNCDYQEVP